jgi:hypothetical protein
VSHDATGSAADVAAVAAGFSSTISESVSAGNAQTVVALVTATFIAAGAGASAQDSVALFSVQISESATGNAISDRAVSLTAIASEIAAAVSSAASALLGVEVLKRISVRVLTIGGAVVHFTRAQATTVKTTGPQVRTTGTNIAVRSKTTEAETVSLKTTPSVRSDNK